MLTKRIIPCLDVDGGRVVKGVSFVQLRDAGDPVELAAFYDREGADELVFLDITASSDGRDTMIDVVRRVSEQVFIPLTVGGGVRSIGDVRSLLEAGADKVSINTAAVLNPQLLAEAAAQFGNQCIVVAIDARALTPDGPRADPRCCRTSTPAGGSWRSPPTAVGRCTCTEGGRRRASTRSGGRATRRRWARARCC